MEGTRVHLRENEEKENVGLLPNNHAHGVGSTRSEDIESVGGTGDISKDSRDEESPEVTLLDWIYESDPIDIEDDLQNPTEGREDEANLKAPFPGFTDIQENKLFTKIFDHSTLLIEIVRKLESRETNRMIRLLKSFRKPVAVPSNFLETRGGSQISIRYVTEEERELRAAEMKQGGLGGGKPPRKLITYNPERASFPAHVFQLLKVPFEFGWKREFVMRSNSTLGMKTGDVYYYPPEGGKLRSSRELQTFLDKNLKHRMLFTIDNFTFSKLPIGINDPSREMVRTAYDGKESVFRKGGPLPNRKHPARPLGPPIGLDIKKGSPDYSQLNSSNSKSASARRSIQLPKRYATPDHHFPQDKRARLSGKRDRDSYGEDNMMEMGMLPPKYPRGMENSSKTSHLPEMKKRGRPFSKEIQRPYEMSGDYEDGMFQISALHKNQQGMLYSAMDNYEEQGKTWKRDLDGKGPGGGDNVAADGEILPSKTEELLPCSIRCPGMTGEIPTLICKRCLCLYHPPCLGFPKDFTMDEFICANCEGGVSPVKQMPKGRNISSPRPLGRPFGSVGRPASKNKKPPPPLIRASFSSLNPPRIPQLQQQASRSIGRPLGPNRFPFPHSSDDSVSISPISMKRGRGRPPKNTSSLFPGLSQRNLTITPISIPRNRAPPLPNLHPVSSGRPSLKKGLTMAPVSMQGSYRGGGGSLQISHAKISSTKSLKAHELKSFGDRGSMSMKPMYSKFPQSVVNIGQKQFIALPYPPATVSRSLNKGASVQPKTKNGIDSSIECKPEVEQEKRVEEASGGVEDLQNEGHDKEKESESGGGSVTSAGGNEIGAGEVDLSDNGPGSALNDLEGVVIEGKAIESN